MAEKKSILAEALLDIKNIQSALNANTKEILRSVAKEEIDSVVKESLLKEDDYYVEDLESTDDVEMGGDADAATADIDVMGGEESEEDELGDLEDSEVAPEPEMGMDSELGMDSVELGGDDMDMTAASDDDVIAIYKKLSGEDEIEIVGDEIHLNISEPGEYVVKTNNAAPAPEADMDVDALEPMGAEDEMEMDAEEMGDEDGVDYEIEMGDEEEGAEEAPEAEETPEFGGEEEEEEEELEENSVRALNNGRNQSLKPENFPEERMGGRLKESASEQLVLETKNKYNALLTEAKKLKGENDEFRGALKEFRTKLVETVVFNSNLTYVTRLFMEHSTTKGEKQNIIKRFDEEVSNLKESKKLYRTIANELDTRKPMNESVESKLIKGATPSTSKQLNESTAYADPSTKRIMDLINRVEKR
jgi:hypothetical protein